MFGKKICIGVDTGYVYFVRITPDDNPSYDTRPWPKNSNTCLLKADQITRLESDHVSQYIARFRLGISLNACAVFVEIR